MEISLLMRLSVLPDRCGFDLSLARELSRTIKEILGSAQSVGCSVDGTTLMTS